MRPDALSLPFMAEPKSTPPEAPVEQAEFARTFAEIALRSKHLVENYYATQKQQGAEDARERGHVREENNRSHPASAPVLKTKPSSGEEFLKNSPGS